MLQIQNVSRSIEGLTIKIKHTLYKDSTNIVLCMYYMYNIIFYM